MKRFLEIFLTPIAVALTGGLVTLFVTREEARYTQAKEHQERQLKLLEIVSEHIASSDPKVRLLAVGLGGGLDPEVSSRVAAAVNLEVEASDEVREGVRRWREHSIATLLASKSMGRTRDSTPLEGFWLLERSEQYGENRPVNWLFASSSQKNNAKLKVCGVGWTGEGGYDGKSGFYEWTFPSSDRTKIKSGTTKLYIDGSGIMYGKVEQEGGDMSDGLNWTFFATRVDRGRLVSLFAKDSSSNDAERIEEWIALNISACRGA